MTHIVGAGLAGLSTAVRLAAAGRPSCLYEAAGHAGGRCRSFHDAALERRIDNGNHLLLSGNDATFEYLATIGAADGLVGPEAAEFRFLDLESGERWSVRPGAGPIPWWIFSNKRRVPGTRFGDYLQGFRLARAGADATVAQCLETKSPLYRRFWAPMAVAVLNTDPDEGAASLLWPVVRQTFARGEAACRPRIARAGLSETFVQPALRFLDGAGCRVRFNHVLRGLTVEADRVARLDFAGEAVALGPGDAVVVAVPPAVAAGIVPGISAPRTSRAIVNGHFLLPQRRDDVTFLGLIGGVCQWLFVRGDIASVTVSAADALADDPADSIARRFWPEVAFALGLGSAPLPAHRIVKEKRATFAQTPEETARRPAARTPWRNLFLAGDWTATGLPATIEGAVVSGLRASEAVMSFIKDLKEGENFDTRGALRKIESEYARG